jgi:hypothetical protein
MCHISNYNLFELWIIKTRSLFEDVQELSLHEHLLIIASPTLNNIIESYLLNFSLHAIQR